MEERKSYSGFSSAKIKQNILLESDITGFRKKIETDFVNKDQEVIDWGDAYESMTQTKGWTYLEAYMMKIIMASMLQDREKELSKGMINVMQHVDQVIKARNDIFERREAKEKENA